MNQAMPQDAMQADPRIDGIKKLVFAGKKVLYSDQTQGKFLRQLDPNAPAESAAKVASVVVVLLVQQSQGQMTPDHVMPAGLILVGDLLDYMVKTFDIQIDDEVTKEAMRLFAEQMLDAFSGPAAADEQAMPMESGLFSRRAANGVSPNPTRSSKPTVLPMRSSLHASTVSSAAPMES